MIVKDQVVMSMLMPLAAHLFMSLIILALPHLTRKEILFGVVLPADFRSRPAGRYAIRAFRIAVMIPAVAGLITIPLLSSRFVPIVLLAPMATIVSGFVVFVQQNRRLKVFAIRPPLVRELELTGEPERLPRFVWLGLLPLLFLAGTALYLHFHWESIPERHAIHWTLDGQPDRWADRSLRGVYGPLILGAEMILWLFGFALAIWYGARRSEPLRRPVLHVFLTLEFVLALMISSLALQPLIRLPILAVAGAFMVIIVASLIYLIRKNRDSRGPLDATPNECWKGGILYYNPNDPVIFVGRRDGAGFTVNLANPWSWAVIGSPVVLVVSGFLMSL
jgi:uncharacterized membrane protein